MLQLLLSKQAATTLASASQLPACMSEEVSEREWGSDRKKGGVSEGVKSADLITWEGEECWLKEMGKTKIEIREKECILM